MKNERLIPFLIEEDKNELPKRGGKYISEEAKSEEELRRIRRKLSECNCDCNCNCNCNCDNDCDCNC